MKTYTTTLALALSLLASSTVLADGGDADSVNEDFLAWSPDSITPSMHQMASAGDNHFGSGQDVHTDIMYGIGLPYEPSFTPVAKRYELGAFCNQSLASLNNQIGQDTLYGNNC